MLQADVVKILGLGIYVMRYVAVAAAVAAVCGHGLASPTPAAADVLVNISKTSQRMAVMVDGSARYNWLVSTGQGRYTTPNGAFQPQWMARKWRSKQYQNAPMPHSIFFHNGYAIHGTTEISRLGRVASHGCVRLHPENAAKLYALIQNQMENTRIVLSNDTIDAPAPAQPPRKPGTLVSENAEGEAEVIAANVEPEEPPVLQKRRVSEKLLEAEMLRTAQAAAKAPAQPRVQTVARSGSQGGFRW